MAIQADKKWALLVMSTLAFTVCVAVWMMFAMIGTIFMLMWGITLVSLVWIYWTEIVPQRNGLRTAPQAA